MLCLRFELFFNHLLQDVARHFQPQCISVLSLSILYHPLRLYQKCPSIFLLFAPFLSLFLCEGCNSSWSFSVPSLPYILIVFCVEVVIPLGRFLCGGCHSSWPFSVWRLSFLLVVFCAEFAIHLDRFLC